MLATVTVAMGLPKGSSAALPLVAIGVPAPMAKCIRFQEKQPAGLGYMGKNLKSRLREKLLGTRFKQQILDDHHTLGGFGNRLYLNHCPDLLAPGYELPFHAHEFGCFSQNGEDGLILFLLSRTGAGRHFVVEIGIEDGRECNSANLILNLGWQACLIETSAQWVKSAERYFRDCRADQRVTLLHAPASAENINDLLAQGQVPEEIDVLSIDIDSNDYWLWSAIDTIMPRIVVIEYNASFGPDRSVTVPYDTSPAPRPQFYHGASLLALCRLGRGKGYILAGCDSRGVNAFFVREDLAVNGGIPAVPHTTAFRPHFRRSRRFSAEQQFQAIAHLPLQQID